MLSYKMTAPSSDEVQAIPSPFLTKLYAGQVGIDSFLKFLIQRTSDPKQKEIRRTARQEIIEMVELEPKPTDKIKMAIYDVDGTLGLLYPVMSTTAVWALSKIANEHGFEAPDLFKKAKEIPDIYLCHSVSAFLAQFSIHMNLDKLRPDHPKNKPIVRDWQKMRLMLNKQWGFKDVASSFKRIKENGGLVYIASNATVASVLHRLGLWTDFKGDQLIDGIVVRDDLPSMSSVNLRACPEEVAFVNKLNRDGKVVVIPDALKKPHPHHLDVCFKHANDQLCQNGYAPIKPGESIIVGDSPTSDGGAAKNLAQRMGSPAQHGLLLKALMTDDVFKDYYKLIGDARFTPDPESVIKVIRTGNYPKPNVILENLNDLFDHYTIASATEPRCKRLPRLTGPSIADAAPL